MACNAADIPFLEFPRDEIIEVFDLFLFFFRPWLIEIVSDHSGELSK